jgi:hypothetical protein
MTLRTLADVRELLRDLQADRRAWSTGRQVAADIETAVSKERQSIIIRRAASRHADYIRFNSRGLIGAHDTVSPPGLGKVKRPIGVFKE